jgi:hypothetical protein
MRVCYTQRIQAEVSSSLWFLSPSCLYTIVLSFKRMWFPIRINGDLRQGVLLITVEGTFLWWAEKSAVIRGGGGACATECRYRTTPRVQFALLWWVSRMVGSRECYENTPSPNPTFLEHISSKRPAFSKRPGTTILFRPPIDWKTILVSDWSENVNPTVFPTHLGNALHAVLTSIWKLFCFQIVWRTARYGL